jgi:hypothetical protein
LLYHFRSTKTRFITDLITMAAGAGLFATGAPPFLSIPLIIPGSSKFELTLDIRTLANGGGNQVYYGNVKITKKVVWLVPVSINIANKTYNAPTGLLPFDTYPGGFYTIFLANQPGAATRDWAFVYDNSFYLQRRFSFIHTTSALDVGGGNVVLTNAEYNARYIGATPPPVPFNTPFANFTSSFNQDNAEWRFDNANTRRLNNLPHEWLFLRNANWLAEEINGNINIRTNCSAFCTNSTITGDPFVCTSRTFTAPFGAGVNYNWTLSNTSIASLTVNGNTATVTRNGTSSGSAVLTVTITGNCGEITRTLNLIIGTPIPEEINGPDYDLCFSGTQNTSGVFSVGNPVAGLSYQWQINGIGAGGGSSITVNSRRWGIDFHSIRVRSYSAQCGYSDWYESSFAIVDCSGEGGYRYSLSPNPASSNLTVSSLLEKDAPKIKIIEIVSKSGIVVFRKNYEMALNKTTIDLNNLRSDVYTVRVGDGKKWYSQNLLIQH